MTQGFSIIIPTYNTLPYLKLFLRSLAENSSFEHQIIVCDDGSSDGTAEFLRAAPGLDPVISPVNRGICNATNLAAARADRELLFIANDDLVAAPGWDRALLDRYARGRVLSAVQVEPGWVPVAGCHIKRDFGRTHSGFRREEFLGFAEQEKNASRGQTRPGINYPFLIERRLWRDLNGLDPRFEPGPGSDPDLFYRLALRGSEMLQVRDSLFYHFGGRSSRFAGESPGQRWKWRRAAKRSRKVFAEKWGGSWEFRFGEVPVVQRPRRTVFFIYGGIGNMVMALPAIHAARKALPPGSLSLAVQTSQMLELIRPEDFQASFSLDQPEHQGLKGLPRLISSLRALEPEATIASVPFPRRKYGLLAVGAGAKKRICEQTPSTFGCNAALKTSPKHFLERNLELLRGIGLEQVFTGFDVPLDGGQLQEAGDLLEQRGLAGKNIAGIHPGAGHPLKRWPEGSFIELGRRLAARGWHLLIFGGPDEKDLVDRVAAGIGERATAFPGSGRLGRTLAQIKLCRAFIANDSGLGHCAAALGVSTTAIFGPTDPGRCRPFGSKVRVVRAQTGCRPCYLSGGRFQRKDCRGECLAGITVPMVLDVLEA